MRVNPPGRRASRAATPIALALAAVLAGGCAPTPTADTGAALLEIGDALNLLRQENALLQAQIDSLRGVVARQDSAIVRLNAAVGVAPR